jgi:glycerol transport system permease protein
MKSAMSSITTSVDAAMSRPRVKRTAHSRTRLWFRVAFAFYLLFLFVPIYWLVRMSLMGTSDILGSFSLLPVNPSFANFALILSDPSWYGTYINSLIYVSLNTIISLAVALPAAYAFSRYRFIGDKHVFFWLFTNRMAPPAVFVLPFFQLYSTVGLIDTHIAVALAHCLFNVPLAVWILEGFMSSVPRSIDETAYIDGYRFPRFFVTVFLPLVRSGIGVTVAMTRTASAAGLDWGLLAAAGVLTMVPGVLVIWFVRNHIAKGFALGRV